MRDYFDIILKAHGAGRHSLMGHTLRPYCLAHSAALKHVRSPLVMGGRVAPVHYLHAARICACESFAGLIGAFDAEPTEAEARALLAIADDPAAEGATRAAWDGYIRDTAPVIEMFRPPGGRPLASPPELTFVVRAAAALRMTFDEVWWAPLGWLRVHLSAVDELEGRGRPWTPEEMATRARLRERGITSTAGRGGPMPRVMSIRAAKQKLLRRMGRG